MAFSRVEVMVKNVENISQSVTDALKNNNINLAQVVIKQINLFLANINSHQIPYSSKHIYMFLLHLIFS